MNENEMRNGDLDALVRELALARNALLAAVQSLPGGVLDAADGQGWTARRHVEYAFATERWLFSRLYNFFDAEVEIYDEAAASMDNERPANPSLPLAGVCAEVWLSGRQTKMCLDIISAEGLDAVRHASAGFPQGGWTIRAIFARACRTYADRARAVSIIASR